MTVMEITLLILGVIIFALSFIIPDKGRAENKNNTEKQRETIRKLMEQELSSISLRVNEMTNETVEYAMDKSERSLEKISNEKIMAVNEYAQTIAEELNKRHQEVMFLYDMLNDKQVDLNNSVRKAEATAREVESASTQASMRTEELNRAMSAPVQETAPADVAPVTGNVNYDMSYEQAYAPVKEAVSFYNNNVEALKARFMEMTRADEAERIEKERLAAQAEEIRRQKEAEELRARQEEEELLRRQEAEALRLKQEEELSKKAADKPKKQNVFSMFNAQIQNDLTSGAEVSGTDFKQVAWESVSPTEVTVNAVPDVINTVESVNENVGTNNHNRRILELFRQGKNTVEIAKELNLGVGEVQLVIDLFEG